MSQIVKFLRDQSGASSIEYAMIASGIAVAVAATVGVIGGKVLGLYTSVAAGM